MSRWATELMGGYSRMGADTPTYASEASRQVLGRGSLYTLAATAPILANVAVTPFVTRLLGTTEYGVVAISIVMISVGMMLAGLGLVTAITRHGVLESSGLEGARALVLKGDSLAVAILGVAAVTGPLWAPVVLNVPWRPALVFTLAAAAGFTLVVNAQAFLRVIDKPFRFVSLTMIATLGGPVAGLVLLWSAGGDADTYMGGMLIGYATAGIAGIAMVLGNGRAHAGKGDLGRALRLGAPTVPHHLALFLANGALVLIAGQVFGAAAGGRMHLALLVGSAPAVITAALSNAWAPIVYRTAPSERGPALERTASDVAAFTAVLAGGVALLAPWLMQVLAPASYAPTDQVAAVGVAAIGSVLSVAYFANVHLVLTVGRSVGLALVATASLVVGVSSSALLSTTGILNVVSVGFPVTYLSLGIGTAVLRRKVSSTQWSESYMSVPLTVGIAAGMLGIVLPVSGSPALIRMLLAAGLGVGGALFAVRVMRR